MTYEFQPGEAVLFHAPGFLSTIATFLAMDEGWPHIRFSDHTDLRPSEATTRPSSVLPISKAAIQAVEIELAMALARADMLRIDVLAKLRDDLKALAAQKEIAS